MSDPSGNSRTLYSLFEETSKTQDSFIIYHDGIKSTRISYKELAANVQVVFSMLANLSSSQEVIACLCGPHILQPILMLGILKSSTAFTFLDLKSPLSFLENLEKYVIVRTLLAEEKTLNSLQFSLCACWETIKSLDIFETPVKVLHFSQNHCSSSNCAQKIKKINEAFYCHGDLAYVIQTSGTTGEPKVVLVPHHCIVPNIVDLRSIYIVNSKDVILLCAPLTFDPSIVEIFVALSSSASLVIVSNYVKSVPEVFARVLNECHVTVMQATPSLLYRCGTSLIKNRILTKNTSLRVLCFGGERCPSLSKLYSWKSDGNKTQFFNIYGITEVSCWSTVEKIGTEKKHCNLEISLGRPLLDTEIEVRDENDELVDEGSGQLFIGGSKRWCVLNDEPWPFNPCRIMRPTGDWVYKAQDGRLYFEGRKDNLIKYHGRKCSLSLLHKVIESKPEISSFSIFFSQSVGKLYVFLALNDASYETEDKLRYSVLQDLQRTEPNIPPVIIIIVPFIPITAHGKADTESLLKLSENNLSEVKRLKGRVSPDNVEEYIRVLWQEYTGNSAIKESDSFILNGGNSVFSVQFALEMEWKFAIPLPNLVEVILNSTFENVCTYVLDCLRAASLNSAKHKKFKKDEQSSTIPVDGNHAVASLPKILDSSSSSSHQPPNMRCCKILTRREKKLMCFCGTCFTCEPEVKSEPEQTSSKSELFLQEEFKFDLKKCIDASPCCCDFVGSCLIAFIGSHSGYFVALDIGKGTAVWTQELPDRIESSACLSSCANFVLVGCYDHFLYCFNAWSGEIVWRYKTDGEVKCSPVVSCKNIVYCGSHDHHLYCLSLNNSGALIWKTRISNGSIFSSPVLSTDNSSLYAATLDGVIASLHPDTGQLVWKYSYTSPLFSSPLTVLSNIFIGSVDGSMLSFNENGELVRKCMTAGPIFSSASYFKCPEKCCEASKGHIVFGSHSCMVYCYSTDGTFQWEFLCNSAVYATPFPFSKNGQSYVAVACTKGTVYILNAHVGNLLYSLNLSGEIFSSPVIINDHLVIGCRDNNLYCFKIKYKVSL